MSSRRESVSRANCHIRYWFYRRSIGNPIPLLQTLREWVRRYRFERANSAQPGAIRNPLIAEPSGNSGELEREDDMLTIAYLAGAQAEKERAALAAQKEAL